MPSMIIYSDENLSDLFTINEATGEYVIPVSKIQLVVKTNGAETTVLKSPCVEPSVCYLM